MKVVVLTILLLLVPRASHADDLQKFLFRLTTASYLTAAFNDAIGTAWCHGKGICYETNPVLKSIAEKHGIVTALTVKGAMHGAVTAVAIKAYKGNEKKVIVTLAALTAAQLFVDIHNLRTINNEIARRSQGH